MKRTLVVFLALAFVMVMTGVAGAAHGPYSATSDACNDCHTIHEANADKLLLAASVRDTCAYCHEETGGFWADSFPTVYSSQFTAGAIHRSDSAAVDIENPDRHGTSTAPIDGVNFSCASCHSPHGQNVVAGFASDTTSASRSKMLRQAGGEYALGSAGVQYDLKGMGEIDDTEYATLWCADCHDSADTGEHTNHPAWTNSASANYDDLNIGGQNDSYVMTPSYSAAEVTSPLTYSSQNLICQSCHEDSREVTAAFDVTNPTSAYAYYPTDNPKAKEFPHSTENASMLVETGDDLCLNCHDLGALP